MCQNSDKCNYWMGSKLKFFPKIQNQSFDLLCAQIQHSSSISSKWKCQGWYWDSWTRFTYAWLWWRIRYLLESWHFETSIRHRITVINRSIIVLDNSANQNLYFNRAMAQASKICSIYIQKYIIHTHIIKLWGTILYVYNLIMVKQTFL